MSKKAALGRGLSALLAESQATYATTETEARPKNLQTLPIHHLVPGRYQPRQYFDSDILEKLAESVRARGVLQPLLVRKLPTGKYEIVAGERRWRAAQQASLHEVPVIVKEMSDAEALEIGLIENLQRQDLNALEEAEAYQRLMDEFSHTQAALGDVVGKSRSHVANTLRLTGLPEAVKTMVRQGQLSAGHARVLVGSPDALKHAAAIVAKGLSVRETERLVTKKPHAAKRKTSGVQEKDADIAAIENDLSERLGLKVTLEAKDGAGRLIIHYSNLDQCDDLLKKLSRG